MEGCYAKDVNALGVPVRLAGVPGCDSGANGPYLPVVRGETRSFSLETASFQPGASNSNNTVQITIFPFAGGFWFLHFAAPAGRPLAAGLYQGATRWPFQAPGVPGLDVSGDGRGCNMLTGEFTVLEAIYGPNGYVQSFHATFEQHCEGAAAALRGEVRITNPPPPPILQISADVSGGTVNRVTGVATLNGTVICSTATMVNIFGVVRQRANRFSLASGTFSLSVPCGPTSTSWSAPAAPQGSVPFGAGTVSVEVTANAFDPNYGTFVTDQFAAAVHLTGSGH
jgi:hypothetical protein